MKKLAQKRVNALLQKHLLTCTAEFYHRQKDRFGDICATEKYAEEPLYFSQLLHRYNPYVYLKQTHDATVISRHTPMALLVSDKGALVEEGDLLRIEGVYYTVNFCENIKRCYYLISLSAQSNRKEEEDD